MENMPLFEAVKKHAAKNARSFHTPGHKGRMPCGAPGAAAARFDLTELEGLDNLAFPGGPIYKAQSKAAAAFGALHTHFLVNGSTNGVLAMIAAAAAAGEEIIIDRGCHISAFSALIFSGARPVYVRPDILPGWGLPLGISAKKVAAALKAHPRARAVFITSPNYFGLTAETEAIAALCRKKSIALLVDEAHGAHFAFHPALPKTAMECGAALCAQSAHKTLPAFTQSALLHVGDEKMAAPAAAAIRLFQTSSPSYILMAGLDFAREFMENEGEQRLRAVLYAISRHMAGLGLLSHPGKDPTRLVLPAFKTGGFKAARRLAEEFNINVEMATERSVVCIAGVMDGEDDIKALADAFSKLNPGAAANSEISPPPSMKAAKSPREAFYSPSLTLPLSKAVGRCSRGAVFAYPPGAAIIAPGEIITFEAVNYISAAAASGGRIMGLDSLGRADVCAP